MADCFESISPDSKSSGLAKYRDEMGRLDEETRPEFDMLYREVALAPITKFSCFFPKINSLITKRAHKLLDYDAAKSKVKHELEKPSKNAAKLDQVSKPRCIVANWV